MHILFCQYVTGAERVLPEGEPKKQSAANPLDQVGKFAEMLLEHDGLYLVSPQLRMLGELGVLSPSTLARARDKVRRASNSDLTKD